MKTCAKNGCNNPVFSNSFCRIHQWMRKDEKYLNSKRFKTRSPVKRDKIPPKSKKRKEEHIRYLDQIKMFWFECVEKKANYCFFCGESSDKMLTIHHLKGRTGHYYLDKEWWVWGHNECHVDKYTMMPYDQLKEEWWYNAFLTRLAEKSMELFNKELKRADKSQKLNPTLFPEENEE
jgi:hypothetical protein